MDCVCLLLAKISSVGDDFSEGKKKRQMKRPGPLGEKGNCFYRLGLQTSV